MKKSLKVLISTICAVVFVALLVFGVLGCYSCERNMRTRFFKNAVAVYISSDYYDEFLNKEFEIEDFELNNIERIEYGNYEYLIYVYLKKPGWVRVNWAIRRFEKLPFVKEAGYVEAVILF